MREESKRQKFVRLAENRMNSILKGISLVGNLSNRSNYDYSKEDVDKIIRTLRKAVSDLESQFASNTRNDFKL